MGVVVAGCGGSSKADAAGAAGTDGRAAQAFPASTAAFFDANIDETSTAWKQLIAVGSRFPSWPKLVTKFNAAANDATDDGPTLAQLRSWLGSELAFGVLDVPTDGADPKVLGFADVRDKAQLEAALKKEKDTRALGTHGAFDLFGSGDDAFVAISDDTALISNDRPAAEAAIDRLAGTGDRLSDLSTFKDTLATLPDRQRRRRLCARARCCSNSSRSVARRIRPTAVQGVTTGAVRQVYAESSTASAASASRSGRPTRACACAAFAPQQRRQEHRRPVRADAARRACPPARGSRPPSATSAPARRAGLDGVLGSNPDAQKQIAQAEPPLGITLDDVFALISGEHALYAGPGAPRLGRA